jgi:HEAT repeat protein
MLDKAFDALRTYDVGVEPKVLDPIHDAVVASHGNAAARQDIETRLLGVLKSDAPHMAKDYVCRQLMAVGTAASVPVLAELLSNAHLSHMARYALERIPAAEAGEALRKALGLLSGTLKSGVICTLAGRKDGQAVDALAGLLSDGDAQISRAAALALGAIGTPEASKALAAGKMGESAVTASIDARLACAERYLAAGDKVNAMAAYQSLAAGDHPKHVKLAATRGLLACAGKKDDSGV